MSNKFLEWNKFLNLKNTSPFFNVQTWQIPFASAATRYQAFLAILRD